jgi:hypothetical protein
MSTFGLEANGKRLKKIWLENFTFQSYDETIGEQSR